jgi:hypothetical protein
LLLTGSCFFGLNRPQHIPSWISAPGPHRSAAPAVPIAGASGAPHLQAAEAYHWKMSRIDPECSDADTSDRSVAADVLLRQEPEEDEDEEEEEEEDDGEEDDDTDEGYSE